MPLPPEIMVTVRQVRPHSGRGDQYFTVTTAGSGAEICRNLFSYPSGPLIHLDLLWTSEEGVRGQSRGLPSGRAGRQRRQQQEERMKACGQQLYSLIFGHGEEFKGFLRRNEVDHRQARLTLALHGNAMALWSVPWELLHDGEEFLALSGRFLFGRVPLGCAQMSLPAVPPPLRLLVVVASPHDQPELEGDEELGVLQTALDRPVREGRVQVEYLEDATLDGIGEALRRFQPHVWHHIGHGVRHRQDGWDYLALEDQHGRTRPADIGDLYRLRHGARELRLVFLAGCHTAPTSDVEAFLGLGLGLLQADVPAVLTVQSSLPATSARRLAGAVYAALADGHTVAQAVARARMALWQSEKGQACDWGAPALYLRAQPLRVVDPGARLPRLAARSAAQDVGGLELPPCFAGRKAELLKLRLALRDSSVNALLLCGSAGVGKSSLAAKLLLCPGTEIDDALVIRCHQADPLDIPAQLARFLEAQGQAGHAEAAALLLDGGQNPAARARKAAALIANRRYLFILDGFEGVLDLPATGVRDRGGTERGQASFPVAHPILAGLLSGLLDARWRTLCLFTSRYRWRGLEEHLPRVTAAELHLSPLPSRQTIMLMDSLPRLRREPLQTKQALYDRVGGHPTTITMLAGWLASRQVTDLPTGLDVDAILPEQRVGLLLPTVLAQLSAAERQALARLSILRTRANDDLLATAGLDRASAGRLLDLSLLQRVQPQEGNLYSVHCVVREQLLGQMEPQQLRELHLWAAAHQGRPFVEMARREAAQSGQTWSEEKIEQRARRDVVLCAVHQTKDMVEARAAMTAALEWQYHLFAAGEREAARDVVVALWAILDRWGQTERVAALLHRHTEASGT